MTHLQFYFSPDQGSIHGSGKIEVEKQWLFGTLIWVYELQYVLDTQNQLWIDYSLSRYLFPGVGMEEMETKLHWFVAQPKGTLRQYKTWRRMPKYTGERRGLFRYMVYPKVTAIAGEGYRKVRKLFRSGECDTLDPFAFVFLPEGTLRVTVDRTHYVFNDIRREKLDEMLDWFTKQTDEELKPFLDTRK